MLLKMSRNACGYLSRSYTSKIVYEKELLLKMLDASFPPHPS